MTHPTSVSPGKGHNNVKALASISHSPRRNSELFRSLIITKLSELSSETSVDSVREAEDNQYLSSSSQSSSPVRSIPASRASVDASYNILHDSNDVESEYIPRLQKQWEQEDELFGLHDESPFYDRLHVLVTQALPVVLSFFLTIGGTFINLLFAGQYVHESGDKSTVFAGVSLANMFANVSCLSILVGMSSAVETLGSQLNGAGRYAEVGIVLQRSILVLTVLTIPIIVLWFFTADIFSALGVEESVCTVIKNFIRIRTIAIPADVINESYEKYLMSIGVVHPSMWSNVGFNLLILILDAIFVYGFHLNYYCLAWSWVIATYLGGFIQLGLSWNLPAVKRTIQPFNLKALQEWLTFIKLGFPGTVMLCSEWWAYEILIIFASTLGTTQVAAQTIILQTASLAFMVPLGIGVATASLVGNSLGADKVILAKLLGKQAIGFILTLEAFVGLIIIALGSYFVDLFTNDPNVKDVATHSIPFLSLFTIIDGLQGVCSGVLRGAGKQFIGAAANLVAFYIIGLPLSWFFCFTLKIGVNGLLMGIAFGTVFQAVVLIILIFCFERYIYSRTVVERTSSFEKLQQRDDLDESIDIELNSIVTNTMITTQIEPNLNIKSLKSPDSPSSALTDLDISV